MGEVIFHSTTGSSVTCRMAQVHIGVRKGSGRWIQDKHAEDCAVCSNAFGMLTRRRHHCRACGDVVCANCSKSARKLELYADLMRVCDCCAQAMADNQRRVTVQELDQEIRSELERRTQLSSEIIDHLDSNGEGVVPPEGLRLLAKHLRHELYDIPLAEITEDQIKPFAGKVNSELVLMLRDSYQTASLQVLFHFLGLSAASTLAELPPVGIYQVVWAGGVRFRKSPQLQDIVEGDFLQVAQCVEIQGFVLGTDGRAYGTWKQPVQWQEDSDEEATDDDVEPVELEVQLEEKADNADAPYYIPYRMDTGELILQWVADGVEAPK